MSITWKQGQVYDYYGAKLRCTNRWFDGALEMVLLCYESNEFGFVRCARTLARCVIPRVIDTLGGVTRPDKCHHDWYGKVTADTGPFAGRECCTACGTPPDEPIDSDLMKKCIRASDRRSKNPEHYYLSHIDYIKWLDEKKKVK